MGVRKLPRNGLDREKTVKKEALFSKGNARWKNIDLFNIDKSITDCILLEELEIPLTIESNAIPREKRENVVQCQELNISQCDSKVKRRKRHDSNAWEKEEAEGKVNGSMVQAGKKKIAKEHFKEYGNMTLHSLLEENEYPEDLKSSMAEWISLLPNFPMALLYALREQRFFCPTPIQSKILKEAVEKCHDIIGAAETGSGKTLSFGIPILIRLIQAYRGRLAKSTELRSFLEALILVPSRELATQVYLHLQAVNTYLPFHIVCVIGGISWQKQMRKVQSYQPQIVIGTPGRLCCLTGSYPQNVSNPDILNEVDIPVSEFLSDMSHVRYLVIDEADRMIEEGHFQEMRYILNHLYEQLHNRKGKLQTFVLSATLCLAEHSASLRLFKTNSKKNSRVSQPKSTMELLQQHIRLNEKYISIVDMTLPNSKDRSVELSHHTPVVRLPPKLNLYVTRCLSEHKEFQLYALLVTYFWGKNKASKVLIFLNAISYVSRLLSLLSLLFGTHGLLTSCKTRKKSKEMSRNPLSLKTARSTEIGDGVRILSDFLCKKGSSTYAKAEDALSPRRSSRREHNIQGKTCDLTIEILAIHSKVKQSRRLKRLDKFLKPNYNGILICTDVVARGLDIPHVDMVVHFQLPRSLSLLIHRSGRTARMQASGDCVLFNTPEDFRALKLLLSPLGQPLCDAKEPPALETMTPYLHRELLERFKLAAEVEYDYHKLNQAKEEKAWLLSSAAQADMICDQLIEFEGETTDSSKEIRLKQKCSYLKELIKRPLLHRV